MAELKFVMLCGIVLFVLFFLVLGTIMALVQLWLDPSEWKIERMPF